MMMRFGDGRFESTSRAPATFNVAGNRVVSPSLVTTVLMKDHCEYTAGWQLVPVEMEEMHAIYDCDC